MCLCVSCAVCVLCVVFVVSVLCCVCCECCVWCFLCVVVVGVWSVVLFVLLVLCVEHGVRLLWIIWHEFEQDKLVAISTFCIPLLKSCVLGNKTSMGNVAQL